MAGLTFVNQVGAVNGMNQAAPGTLIPETFVRWAQDVLFDRAGLMRRRGPFQKYTFYKTVSNVTSEWDYASLLTNPNADEQRMLGVFSTYDPQNNQRIGILVSTYLSASSSYETTLHVFDNTFTYLGSETLPFNIPPLSIVVGKPALGGGLLISVVETPGNVGTHYMFYWRGGYSSKKSSVTGTFTLSAPDGFSSEHSGISSTITPSSMDNISSGQFVYANGYYSVSNKALTSNVATLTTTTAHGLSVGDSVTISGVDSTFNGTYSVSAVSSTTTFSYSKTASNVASTSVSPVGKALVNKDYYIGVVKTVGASTIALEKRPYIWQSIIDNNHSINFTGVSASATSTEITYTLSSSVPFETGDVLLITGFSNAAFNYTSASVINVNGNTFKITNNSSATGTQTAIGTVKMANDLEDINLSSVALKFISVRPYTHRHGRGLLSILDDDITTIISGTAGTSAEGHWHAANVTDYNLYRASDNAYLGKVKDTLDENSKASNVTGHLYSDPGVKLNGEEYIMRSTDNTDLTNDFCIGNTASNTPYNHAGLYTAVYAGMQWYGSFAQDDKNTNRVVFSAYHDKEAVDLSRDAADSIIFPGKSKFRGMAASNAGLLVFLEDRTYIIRGNDRTNFSVEQLTPEGCLCPSSIVEYGGGVFWAGKSGIMYYDGASIRNLTRDNLGLYYNDSLDEFNPETDRVIGFFHKNNLMMHFTSWKSPFKPFRYEPVYASDWYTIPEAIEKQVWKNFDPDFSPVDFITYNNTPIYWDRTALNDAGENSSGGLLGTWGTNSTTYTFNWGNTSNLYKWGPVRANTSITFNIYLPTNALTTLSNMDFCSATTMESLNGIKTLMGVNSVENNLLRARVIDIHPVFDTITYGEDDLTVEKINIPYANLITGPDFYLQTKHYTVGDPVLRKWFQRVMLSMLLYDGCLRMDFVDDDDNDMVDINKKKHRYWDLFTEQGYNWDYLTNTQFPKIVSPHASEWNYVEQAGYSWNELFTADFNRYMKRFSWRKSSIGFRLYQLNKYKKPYHGTITKPNQVQLQALSIGFKPMRQGRI